MMAPAHASYRHVQPFRALWVLMPLSSAVVALVLWGSGDPQARLGIGIVLVTTVVTLAVLGRLVIEVHADRVTWHFGWFGLPRWSLPLARIVRCEPGRGSPVGAGIKGTRRHRIYSAEIGGPALRLTLDDGRSITLGTPEPDRLRSFIEARLPARR